MKKGINIWSFGPDASVRDCMQLAKDAGFEGIELALAETGELSLESKESEVQQIKSYRHPEGWQAMLRVRSDQPEAMVVFHTFGGLLPAQIDVQVSLDKEYEIEAIYAEDHKDITLHEGLLSYKVKGDFHAAAVLLRSIQAQ